MKNQWLVINQLDRLLGEWKTTHRKSGKPRVGWIKTIRTALSMTEEQLAYRLGLTRGRINQLEKAEAENAVTLRTLQETANALGCELVYAIVPKGDTSLENIITTRAQKIAKNKVAQIAHSMSLEAQSLDKAMLQTQTDKLAENLKAHLNTKFWASLDEEQPPKQNMESDSLQQLINILKRKNNDAI